MTVASFTQVAFRFRNDDGSESTATWKAAQNTSVRLTVPTGSFRLRFLIDETNNRSWTSKTWYLRYSKNGGAYAEVGDSGDLAVVPSTNVTNDGDCTSQLTGGSGSFLTDNNGIKESGGNLYVTNSGSSNNFFETEWVLNVSGGGWAHGDYLDFRIYDGTSALAAYTQTPRLTLTVNISIDMSGAPVTAVAASVAPTVRLGSISITPAAVTAVAASVAPTVRLGSTSVTPAAVTAVAANVDPSVTIKAQVTPAAVSAVATTTAPAVQLGSVSITPAARSAVASRAGPTVRLGSMSITPTAVGLRASSYPVGSGTTAEEQALEWATIHVKQARVDFTDTRSLSEIDAGGDWFYIRGSGAGEAELSGGAFVGGNAPSGGKWLVLSAGSKKTNLIGYRWQGMLVRVRVDDPSTLHKVWIGVSHAKPQLELGATSPLSLRQWAYARVGNDTAPYVCLEFSDVNKVSYEGGDFRLVDGQWAWLRLETYLIPFGSSGHLIRFKAWSDGDREPADWLVTLPASFYVVIGAAWGYVWLESSDAGPSGTFSIDSILHYTGQAVATTEATAIAVSVDPTVQYGSTSVTPEAVTAVAASVAPTVQYGSTSVTPAALTAVAGSSDPTVQLGSLSITPAALTAVAGSVAPTIQYGSTSVTPAAVTAVAASVDPTVQETGGLRLYPAPVTAVAGSVAPTIQYGSTSVTPAAVTAVVASVDPTVQLGSLSITPAAVTAVGASVAPTIQLGSLSVTPAAVTAVVASTAPTVQLGSLSITPAARTARVSSYPVGAGVAAYEKVYEWATVRIAPEAIDFAGSRALSTVDSGNDWFYIQGAGAGEAALSGGAFVGNNAPSGGKWLILSSAAIESGASVAGQLQGMLVRVKVDDPSTLHKVWVAVHNGTPSLVLGAAAPTNLSPFAYAKVGNDTEPYARLKAGSDDDSYTGGSFRLVDGQWAWLRLEVYLVLFGRSHWLRFKAWQDGEREPSAWQIELSSTGSPTGADYWGYVWLESSDAGPSGTFSVDSIAQYRGVQIATDQATAVATTTAPTVELGSLSITPAAVTAVVASTAPTVLLGSTSITPAAVTAVAASTDPAIQLGSLSITPAALTAVAGSSDPTVQLGSLSITPAALTAVAGSVAPTIQYGSTSITPAALTAVAGSSDPTVQLGSTSVTPVAATTVAAAADPTVYGLGVITPAAVTVVAATMAPAVLLGSLSLTPAAVTAVAVSIAPTVQLGSLSITPTAVTVVAATVAPAVLLGSLSITPAAVTVVAVSIAPTVQLGSLSITAVAVAVVATVAPTIQLGSISVLPDARYAIAAAVNPEIWGTGRVAPAALSAVTTAVSPTVELGSVTVSPGSVSGIVTSVAPLAYFSSTSLTPSAGSLVCAVVRPTVLEEELARRIVELVVIAILAVRFEARTRQQYGWNVGAGLGSIDEDVMSRQQHEWRVRARRQAIGDV